MCGVRGSSAFSRFKRKRGKSDLIEGKKCSRLNQKSKCDNNGNLAYTVLVIVRFWNFIIPVPRIFRGSAEI